GLVIRSCCKPTALAIRGNPVDRGSVKAGFQAQHGGGGWFACQGNRGWQQDEEEDEQVFHGIGLLYVEQGKQQHTGKAVRLSSWLVDTLEQENR
ncbi:MAG: hypothetical protein D3907_15360, partial [Candidatus Electrothrix sp. AUS3]|nr:hypothetical protein [Candidatus Electrothrix gigas]